MADNSDPSGIIVHPKLPVPQGPAQRPSTPAVGGGGVTLSMPKLAAALVLALAVGATAGYLGKPSQSGQLANVQKQAATAQTAASVEKDRADGAQKQVEVLTKDKQALEAQLAAAAIALAENEKAAATLNADASKKLAASVDRSTGEVSTEGEEIHLKLVDKVLFELGDDQLTAKGKAVMAKVGKALAALPEKQIWVQGHTDDSPIGAPPEVAAAKPAKGAKKLPKPVEPPPPGPRFASNWELSAARALQVVHYLQDVAKIDPARLGALAFGQYRPVSKSNKAQNRRIEIVLYPHKAVIERVKP